MSEPSESTINHPLVLWTVDTLDWKTKDAQKTLQAVINDGYLDGKIILMHSIHEQSARAAELLIPYLLERGELPQAHEVYR